MCDLRRNDKTITYPSSSSCNKGTTIQHFQFELIGTDRFDLDLYVKLRKEYFKK